MVGPGHHGRRSWPIVVRRARHEDFGTVAGFTQDTFPGWGDYVPRVFAEWVDASDGVFLAVTAPDAGGVDAEGVPLAPGQVIAVARIAFLTPQEAWLEGIRVDPRVRGLGVATDLQVAELRWAAAHGVSVMRYLTGEHNEGSHRLGAKHGFEMTGPMRWYGWDGESGDEPPAPDTSLLVAAGGVLAVPARAADSWWEAVQADPTFRAAGGLYEPRSWALQELTPERFDAHVAAEDVVVWPGDAASLDGPPSGPWALAIVRAGPEGEDDPRLPPAPALLAGDGAAAIQLVRTLSGGRPGLPRVRLPDPDAPILRDGVGEAWTNAGWVPAPRAIHVFERLIDEDHPLPEPDDPSLLIYGDDPRPRAVPRSS
jgi:GNAT superfamily N-acetyltransferase